MIKNRKGLSLFEFVIYLLLFSVIATGSAYWLNAAWYIITNFSAHANRSINLHSAHDLLVRDIQSACAQKKDWKKIAEDELVWRSGEHDIGWHCEDGQLLRCEGIYDQKLGQWHKKVQSVVARSVAQVRFQLYGQREVKQVGFEIKSKGNKEYSVANRVTVCNGSVG